MRALAVVAVMVYHANPAWLSGGFLGVEVFFVISGYLITLLLMAERERSGTVDLSAFWARRARRLLPALFTMMFLLLIYTTLFRPDRLGELRGDMFAGILYVENWYQIWVGQGYADSGDFSALRHIWSLAVEEQFYILWPLVMLFMLRKGTRRLATTALWLFGFALAITVVTAVLVPTGRIIDCANTPDAYWTIGERCIAKADTLYLSTITRAGGLMLGAGFAMIWRPVAIMRSPIRDRARLLDVISVFALVALAMLHWRLHYITPDGVDAGLFRGGFLLTGLATLVVIAVVTHRYTAMSKILGNPVFVWVGTRSYGLYLYHWVIYQVIRRVAGRPLSINEFIVAMVATVILTELSYRIVETPIRKRQVAVWWMGLRRRRDPIPRQMVTATGLAAVALFTFGAIRLGVAENIPNEIEQGLEEGAGSVENFEDFLGASATSTSAPVDPSSTTAPSAGATTTSSTTTTTTLPKEQIQYLAIGDSVMLGAASNLKERGYTVFAEENRQLKDIIPYMQKLDDAGLIGDYVVIHLGTNGTISADSLDALLATVSDAKNVVLVNVRANKSWTAPNNELLKSRDTGGDNRTLLDWNSVSNECTGNCFADDGIHLSGAGKEFYTTKIDCILRLC